MGCGNRRGVNQFQKQDGLKILPSCVDIPEVINYNTEQLNEKLLKEHQITQSNNQNESTNTNKNQNGDNQTQNKAFTNS